MKHVIVAKEEGRFLGWPANDGVWSWGDEIVVGYTNGAYEFKEQGHRISHEQPSLAALSRSCDGGETWQREEAAGYTMGGEPIPAEEIDFAHPDLAIRCSANRLLVSCDRCHSWRGPYLLPSFGFSEPLTSRTDYLVLGEGECLFFLSVRAPQVMAGLRDRAFCARTDDGGKSFSFVSWMLPEPPGTRSVMPSTVRAGEGRLVSAMRRRRDLEVDGEPVKNSWIDSAESVDGGLSWRFLGKVAATHPPELPSNGNPPALVCLADGRLVCAYGYRAGEQSGIRARFAPPGGTPWGEEMVIRDGAQYGDMGYPRMVTRSDGKLVTIYYFNSAEHPQQHIAATIWDPSEHAEISP